MQTLGKNSLYRRLTVDGTNYTLAAGTTDVTSGEVDTRGYGGTFFMLNVGAMAANATVDVKVQQSDTSGSGFADLAGTASIQLTTAHANKAILIDVRLARERFVKLAIARGDSGNSTIDSLAAIQYNPGQAAPAIDSMTYSLEVFSEPMEGTA